MVTPNGFANRSVRWQWVPDTHAYSSAHHYPGAGTHTDPDADSRPAHLHTDS
ncbi:MAG: hypothetical protein O6920_07475 [Chloroflexi bacterium]|nr:hypothetical protein [Chloroflexota bacterium]